MFTVLSSWQSHCKSSPGSFDKCRTAPSGRQPKTKPDDLGRESACTGCQKLHPLSPLIIGLLSPKADTHFTIPQRVEGWVDLVGWLHTEMVYPPTDTLVLTGSDVVQLCWSRPNALRLSQTACLLWHPTWKQSGSIPRWLQVPHGPMDN